MRAISTTIRHMVQRGEEEEEEEGEGERLWRGWGVRGASVQSIGPKRARGCARFPHPPAGVQLLLRDVRGASEQGAKRTGILLRSFSTLRDRASSKGERGCGPRALGAVAAAVGLGFPFPGTQCIHYFTMSLIN
jgi:hypothetical protein